MFCSSSECKGEDKVIQEQGDVIAAEGDTVTLGCRYETSDPFPYLFWYKQEINNFPKYVLRRDTTGTEDNDQEFPKDRFDAKINKAEKSAPLKIQKLQPTVTGNSKTLYKNLWKGNNTACLATGFSRHNATSYHWNYSSEFSETKAVAISPNLDLCLCLLADIFLIMLFADPKVNLMSLTILALRVIFIKTIIFNIIMTLRLWISQCEYKTNVTCLYLWPGDWGDV
uniref:Immunoglobulin V-set domain-containing protein n=1 Tax=Astatotilapia calliptera TaxID=8154 RepID=A0A3P8QLD7_ASTCA